MSEPDPSQVRLALPKGRIQPAVFALLSAAGIEVRTGARGYRPTLSLENYVAKIQKPQDIVKMLRHGSRDLGFAGRDWVTEKRADLVELLDTGLDPVKVVVAAPEGANPLEASRGERLVIATEYASLTADWIRRRDLDADVLETSGATEVFPPEDADLIVDNVATGNTLLANRLVVIDEILQSSTCLYASPASLEIPWKRTAIEEFVLLLEAVLDARKRAMLELNVQRENLERVVEALPSMRAPTISQLGEDAGFAVRAAVPRRELASIVPKLKSCGGTDIVVSTVEQLVS